MKQLSLDPRQLITSTLVRPFGQLPDDALISKPAAAVLLNVSAKTLSRHMERKNLKPANSRRDVKKAELMRWYRIHRNLRPGRPRKPRQQALFRKAVS